MANCLANTTIQVLRQVVDYDVAGQRIDNVMSVVHNNVDARVEQISSTATVKYEGNMYKYDYLIHIWGQIDIHDSDYIHDNSTGKRYVVDRVEGASLLVCPPISKLQLYCSVLADDRFNNSDVNIP